MSIKSDASPDEVVSPYYKNNELICIKWQEYILKREGKIKGTYNAWSYILKSIVKGKKEWLIDVKKSTLSNGSIFFSSKSQNLQEILKFQSIFKNTECENFCISRSIFKRKKQDHPFYYQVESLLKDSISDKSLYEASFKDNRLTIIFHYKNDWFKMADEILDFDYNK